MSKARKERTHMTGMSNRPTNGPVREGPIDYDNTHRSTVPRGMTHKQDTQVPATMHGEGNRDFEPKLAGYTYRQPNVDPKATQRAKKETTARLAQEEMERTALLPSTVLAAPRGSNMVRQEPEQRQERKKAYKQAPRWNPRSWYEDPKCERQPNQKEQGEPWNSRESAKEQGDIKGHDRLMRTVRRPEDVATPQSDSGMKHPLNNDTEQYYPGRDLIDAVGDAPSNDFQVRPVNLPDFYNPPPEGEGDGVMRMQRIREVIRQRYAGRPRLIGVFRNCTLTKPGFVFPRDLQQVFDQMGIKVSPHECDMLVKAVDKDHKGAVTFEEFADLIYGDKINVGGKAHEPQERHVRHVTRTLVDNLISNGQALGKAFCQIDPERRYEVSKPQFANALGSACNHISKQAIDFLWAAQFPGQAHEDCDSKNVDWRDFMSQLAHFAHDHRAPTPCCVQGRKRQYDLLQKTAAITGGYLTDLDLNRPDQNPDDEVRLVADKLSHRHTDLPHKPRDASFLTEHFVENLRSKAERVERALPSRIPKARLKELLGNRSMVHQDELIDLITSELEQPGVPRALPAQIPLYKSADPQVMTIGPGGEGDFADAAADSLGTSGKALGGGYGGPACLKMVRADIESFVATQATNRDHEVDVSRLIKNVYRPPDEKHQIDIVNDGLNRQLRGLRPPRERPQHGEDGHNRYENYWQARHLMEQVNEAIAYVESSNGGRIKPSKVFKRLDMDNDGYITLSDLQSACEKYKIIANAPDLHAMFSELDRQDNGSIDIGEFTRHYAVYSGSMLDNMQKPIKSVYHEGGVEIGGPVQEQLDKTNLAASKSHMPEPLNSPKSSGSRPRSCPSNRSQISRTGESIAQEPTIYDPQVATLTGKARVSDIKRARFMEWKPHKSELFTSLPRTRYGMTCYPDTRHVTEPSVPLSGSFLPDEHRFKTTASVGSIFAVPDHNHPQTVDAMKKHARNEFRVERMRQRQAEFADRCYAANEASREFDELKIARKAMNIMNYERRCNMACA